MKTIFTLLLLTALWPVQAQSKRYEPTWESLDQRPTPQWFIDARSEERRVGKECA